MVNWLVNSGLRFGRLAVAAAIGILVIGVLQLRGAPVDVYPEFDPPAVQVQAEALGLSAQEVEQLITVPLEQDLLNGIPWLAHIRSRSMPGLSAIDLEFEPGTDLYQARQMVQERMSQAKALPNVGTPPAMIQPTSSTARVALIGMTSKTVSTMQMSVLARWQVRPRLMSIPGVANVSIWGQRDRQLQVQVDPARLRRHQVTLTQLIESTGNALWVSPLSFVEASTPGTGGFVETPTQRLGVQHVQPITKAAQLAGVAVEGERSRPLRIGDVATVREDHQPLIGDASLDGQPGLMLVVERFPGANTAQVTRDVEAALEAMAPGLSGISVDSQVFRPANYLTTALDHLGLVGLGSLVLLLLGLGAVLLSWRMALIAAVSVPLALVAAASVLQLRGEALTTMTLIGLAAALAVVVDDVVGDVDETRRRLSAAVAGERPPATTVIKDVVVSRRGPLLFATAIVFLGLLPVLWLGGLAGAIARPAVLTFGLAVLAGTAVSLLVTPALAALVAPRSGRELRPGPLEGLVHRGFDRIAAPALARPILVVVAAALVLAAGIGVSVLGGTGKLLPTLHDRNLVVRLQAVPGTSLVEMQRLSSSMAVEMRGVKGVESAGAHVGRAITADEIVDVNAAEVWVKLADDADYLTSLEAIRAVTRAFPGLETSVSTYADDRLAAGTETAPADLTVRVYGEDLGALRDTAEQVSELLGTVGGVVTPRIEAQLSQPTVEISVDLAAAQRYGLRPGDVRREASTLISGLTVGSLYEEQKIFDVVVWGGPATRQSMASLGSLLIDTPSGRQVRLDQVARIRLASNPVVITHDAVSRSLDVYATVRGRDAASVAAEVSTRLRGLAMPYEYRAEVLGDAVQRQVDRQRLIVVGAVVAACAFLLLQAATGSWRVALGLFLALPVAASGGLLVAPVMGGIGSLAVLAAVLSALALAIRQSLVLVRRARDDEGGSLAAAARSSAPAVLGVAMVTAAVLAIPAVVPGVAGLEVLHPFAVTLLCGLVTSVLTVLLVVPALAGALTRNAGGGDGASGARGPDADPSVRAEEVTA